MFLIRAAAAAASSVDSRQTPTQTRSQSIDKGKGIKKTEHHRDVAKLIVERFQGLTVQAHHLHWQQKTDVCKLYTAVYKSKCKNKAF